MTNTPLQAAPNTAELVQKIDALVQAMSKPKKSKKNNDEKDNNEKSATVGRPKTSKQVLDQIKGEKLVKDAGRFYHVPENTQAYEIGSAQHREYLTRLAYKKLKIVMNGAQYDEVKNVLRAETDFTGIEEKVYLRVANIDNKEVYIDLCNQGKFIKITPDGWDITKESPVAFFRPPNLHPLPIPNKNGTIDDLAKILDLEDDEFILLRSVVCSWMRGTPNERTTHPILSLEGPAGAAKSTKSKAIKYTIDPGTPEVRLSPKTPQDLAVGAKVSYVCVIDNISHFEAPIQDTLCGIASGTATAARKLFTDDEESVVEICRPQILNGISYHARPDLQSRMIVVNLPAIPKSKRKTEAAIWRQVEQVRPSILGGICTAIANALKAIPSINPDDYELPRLADFSVFALALEMGNDWELGKTIELLNANQDEALSTLALDEPVILTIQKLFDFTMKSELIYTPSDFYEALNAQASETHKHDKRWPSSSTALGMKLARLKDPLEAVGIGYEDDRRTTYNNGIRKDERVKRFFKIKKTNDRTTDEAIEKLIF